jgi:dienelactone hydrolase
MTPRGCSLAKFRSRSPNGEIPDRPSYRQEQAEDGWKKLQDWFNKHGM